MTYPTSLLIEPCREPVLIWPYADAPDAYRQLDDGHDAGLYLVRLPAGLPDGVPGLALLPEPCRAYVIPTTGARIYISNAEGWGC